MRLALAAILAFVGCSHLSSPLRKPKLDRTLDSWLGADASKLISSWGPPTSTYAMPNGNTLYTYVKGNGSSAVAIPLGTGVYYQDRDNKCNISFTADSASTIRNWRYEGACR